jgi:hypothetical protein
MTPEQRQLEFDRTAAEQGKRDGMKRAAASKAILLGLAREIARNYAMAHGEVTADDVKRVMLEQYGYESWELGNASGSIFTGGDFEFTGRYIKSDRPDSHRNLLRIWKLKS